MIEIHNVKDIPLALGTAQHAVSGDAVNDTFTITVRYMRAQSNGDTIAIGIELSDNTRNLNESRRYAVATKLFPALELKRGPITREKFAQIEASAALSAAWQRGLSILAYGANSAQALTLKLRQRGFDAQTVERAVAMIREQGYLQEEGDACREAERCLNKGWGLRRIGQYLRQRGYDAAAVRCALDALADEDFFERCRRVTQKYQSAPPADDKQRQKIVAHLMRYGYDMDAIRYALNEAWKDEP